MENSYKLEKFPLPACGLWYYIKTSDGYELYDCFKSYCRTFKIWADIHDYIRKSCE